MNTNITKGKWTADEKTYSLESCRIYGLNVIEVSCKKNDEDAGEWIAYVRGNSFEEAKANAQAIASLPDIMRENEELELMNFKFANENEELKARCETYKKDYDSMVKEVLRLSGENSELFSALNYLLSSYNADFELITGAKLNDTEAVKKAKLAITKATK